MFKQPMMFVAALVFFVTAAAAVADAEDASALHGRWLATSVVMGGEEAEHDELILEIYADGTIKAYEDGEIENEGRYEIEGDELRIYEEGDEPEAVMTFSVDGDTLVLTLEVAPGFEVVITYERQGDVEGDE